MLALAAMAGAQPADKPELGPAPVVVAGREQMGSAGELARPEAGGNWIETADRRQVRTKYQSTYLPALSVPMNWSGNVGSCDAGTTAQAYRDAVATLINWYRGMAGSPAGVTLNPSYNAPDQQAALMFSANNKLQHTGIPTNWACYSAAGATAAANSNICLWSRGMPTGCIDAYMEDYGASNTAVGHRRWILRPQTLSMGTGDTAPGAHSWANALWVLDGTPSTPRPATRDTFVAWPSKGYFPYNLVPDRWSFSYPNASFTNTTVTVTRDGASIPVTLLPVANGYGENTLVWTLAGWDGSAPAADSTVVVTLNNVTIGGSGQSFSYAVTVFDPNSAAQGPLPDVDHDGAPDVVWQHPSAGDIWAWLMSGPAMANYQSLGGHPEYRVVVVGDFNGDQQLDLILQHPANGDAWVWYLNQGHYIGYAQISGPHSYRIVAAADLNADGKPDLIWQHPANRDVWVWLMNGATASGYAQISGPHTYRVVASGDVNGDGKSDLVWQHPSNGDVWAWFMNGTTPAGYAQLAGPMAYEVAGLGDYNEDGNLDLLWQHPAAGDVWLWYLNGVSAVGYAQIAGPTIYKAIGWR